MEDLEVLPVVTLGLGALLIWAGLTGVSPVQRVKQILTQGGIQSNPVAGHTTNPANTTQGSGTVYVQPLYTQKRDYLA